MSDKLNLTPAQALYVAVRMEQRAIKLYERAQMVFSQGRMKQALEEILHDERVHLETFQGLLDKAGDINTEDALLLDTEAGTVLFAGGLTGAVREGAFDSAKSLMQYAADEEEQAAKRYNFYAERTEGAAKETFLDIARQEQRHLERLLGQIFLLEEELDV